MTPLLGADLPMSGLEHPASRDLSLIDPTRPVFEIDDGSGATDRRPSDYRGCLLVQLGVDRAVMSNGKVTLSTPLAPIVGYVEQSGLAPPGDARLDQ